jgi:lipoprotein-anchoring transpeptidase ErfK/SrfK
MPKRLIHFISVLLVVLLISGCQATPATADNSQTSTLPETSTTSEAAPSPTPLVTVDPTTTSTADVTTTQVTTIPTTTETTAESTTPTTTQKPKPTPTPYSKPYYLYAVKSKFTLVAYSKADDGTYTHIARVMRMAIGEGTMTPSGKFKLGIRYIWYYFDKSYEYAHYAVSYNENMGLKIHGPLFLKKDPTTMNDTSYERIGTKDTRGCLRLTTADAYWVYSNCASGTILEIVTNTTREGFPSTPSLPDIIISGQDPTDPNLPAPAATTTTAASATAGALTAWFNAFKPWSYINH